ncbi:MAG: SPFH domain-containing protein [Actinomycetota bacterium]
MNDSPQPTAPVPHTVPDLGSTIAEKPGRASAGIVGILALLAAVIGVVASIVLIATVSPIFVITLVVSAVLGTVWLIPHYLLQPNEALVVILFGRYRGTITEPGWYWTANPFTKAESRKVSQRVHNFQTPVSKINDAEGNPIEIAAVVVWRVTDTAKAVFDVDDYDDYVVVQSETAIRHLGTQYPYDDFQGDRTSLRADPDIVAASLHEELQQRLDDAGIEVVEARLTHLAYATEIAEAMLRRQQAAAVVAARRTIVEGAVGMVEDALEMLGERDVVELDEERKATMVSNLLVVLTSENQTTPVVNAGSIY